jgi:hypothetical protein
VKINLPTKTMGEIVKSLEIKNQASTRFNGKDYYFRKERFSLESGTPSNIKATLESLDKKVEKIIQREAASSHCSFATIGRVREQQENLESGKVVYIYFFSNNEFDTVFPDKLVTQYELHSWTKAAE